MDIISDISNKHSEYQGSELTEVIRNAGLAIEESRILSPRQACYDSIPIDLDERIKTYLAQEYPLGLYLHQSAAIKKSLDGNDICLATSTASGKSLVFMTVALQLILEDKVATVIALYPAKALMHDQFTKWKSFFDRFGFSLGYIDGSVYTGLRENILKSNRVVLMTPDVAHAWLLGKSQESTVSRFLRNLKLLILDEAHVYDGVFGTNMAFFIRRLLAISGVARIISSTATIGSPERFIELLTGRKPVLIDSNIDGSPAPEKEFFSLLSPRGGYFDSACKLIRSISELNTGKFLVFADSRKTVEQIVAISKRSEPTQDEKDLLVLDSELWTFPGNMKVVPYRAGYEEEDRANIQDALSDGSLRGVVSTSAMELGIDIGDIEIVVLLKPPTSIKSFWQRVGRMGRKDKGVCLIIHDQFSRSGYSKNLETILMSVPETCWLYLDNKYIQYAHALCAAQEVSQVYSNQKTKAIFNSLPVDFSKFLENEIDPKESIPEDLYPLKQRAQSDPHIEFPLRSDIGRTFQISERHGLQALQLGSVNYAQALREAYPGAIYYYMARPYRVVKFNTRTAEIFVDRERAITTKPILQNMVFPKIPGGIMKLKRCELGFIMESELQVNERVIGFREQKGKNSDLFNYGSTSPYSQRPVVRFFETTGICWFFKDSSTYAEKIASIVLDSFSEICGIQERDLGVGTFHIKKSSFWENECNGICIYDATYGSLRISKQLLERFEEVLDFATIREKTFAEEEKDEIVRQEHLAFLNVIQSLRSYFSKCHDSTDFMFYSDTPHEEVEGWTKVIASGESAIIHDSGGDEEVVIQGYLSTPKGLFYHLQTFDNGLKRSIPARMVVPLSDTKFVYINLNTGEVREN